MSSRTPVPSLAARSMIAVACSAALLFFFFRMVVLTPIIDGDSFWHLATGRLIAQTGAVPQADPFCFTTEGSSWININWLSQIVLFRAFELWGYAGASTVTAWMFGIALLACLMAMNRAEAALLPCLLAVSFVIFLLVFCGQVRPQAFSFALFAVLSALVFTRRDNLGAFGSAFAALTMLVWNNLHGGVLFGYILLIADAAGSAADAWRSGSGNFPRRSRLLLMIAAIGAAGFFFHPHGFATLEHIILYKARMKDIFYQEIWELRPTSFESKLGIALAAYIVLIAFAAAAVRPPVRWRIILPFLAFLYIAIAIKRGLPYFALFAAPHAAVVWTSLLQRFIPASAGRKTARISLTAMSFTLPLVLACWTVLHVPKRTPGHEANHLLIPPGSFPLEAAEFLVREAPPDARIFGEYQAAGYLLWRLGPRKQLFIDGRGDLHSQRTTFEDYMAIKQLDTGWQERVTSYSIDFVLMPHDAQLLTELSKIGWQAVHQDGFFRVLRRPQ